VSNLVWALAMLRVAPGPGLSAALAGRAAAMRAEYTPQEVVSLLWGLAALAADRLAGGAEWAAAAAALAPLLAGAAAAGGGAAGEGRAAWLSQLHQALLCAALDGFLRGAADLPALAGPALAARCRRAFEAAPATGSRLQAAVARGLAAAGARFVEEALEPATGYRVDVLILDPGPAAGVGEPGPAAGGEPGPATGGEPGPAAGGEAAAAAAAVGRGGCILEVDGPKHYLAGPGGRRRPNGAAALKRRLLARAGWRVITVPYWEWDACPGEPARQAYLRRLLRDGGEPARPASPPPPPPPA
jgi:hypothetical protein